MMASNDNPIFVLGLGSIGSFIAQSLRSIPDPPPVTLLIHREGLFNELSANNWKLGIRIGEGTELKQCSGFNAEQLYKPSPNSIQKIRYLVVAVKASATVAALEPLKDRIGRDTTICLFQNGLGQIDDLNEHLFPDTSTRPMYMCGILRHGVYLKSATEAVLSGSTGSASIGLTCTNQEILESSDRRFVVDALLQAPMLNCNELTRSELLEIQLLKLATNCLINPLTALLDVRNGEILNHHTLVPLQKQVLNEISQVFQNLPELELPIGDRPKFTVESLEAAFRDTVEKTAYNSSSMREDILKGRAVEVDFINGWIIRRGRDLGIQCLANSCLTQLIFAKSNIKSK
ncbi:2-dehydropantoate 2-reductase family protein [Penicillium angulare]|uniref:2-dehydropantoate 2-reductase family protein n=1 Tax=Penicillium angulare TaxID=116970 RepID=UPI002540409B|nr:2-dehydropantoate 2-reductase family protein [Penicillium angulare]KAJ5263546.1 2-dehydropantoate 2-reductase family protein [Penicillium angulare]